MNKNSLISGVIFGLIFLALGGILFAIKGESTLILIIAIADLFFGLALVACGIISFGKKKPAAGSGPDYYDEPEPKPERDNAPLQYSAPEPSVPERTAEPEPEQPESAAPEVPAFASMSPDRIREEEMRLREESHRSSARAHQLIDEAKAAIEQANYDEEALAAAQEESRALTGAAHQNALKNIDRLARQAAESSNNAAAAKQKARAARDEARHIAELHSMAVEAAAGSMDDDF